MLFIQTIHGDAVKAQSVHCFKLLTSSDDDSLMMQELHKTEILLEGYSEDKTLLGIFNLETLLPCLLVDPFYKYRYRDLKRQNTSLLKESISEMQSFQAAGFKAK